MTATTQGPLAGTLEPGRTDAGTLNPAPTYVTLGLPHTAHARLCALV
jgi:hypothetical protein